MESLIGPLGNGPKDIQTSGLRHYAAQEQCRQDGSQHGQPPQTPGRPDPGLGGEGTPVCLGCRNKLPILKIVQGAAIGMGAVLGLELLPGGV